MESGLDTLVKSLEQIPERISTRHGEIRLLRRVLTNHKIMHLCEVCAGLYRFHSFPATPFVPCAKSLTVELCVRLERHATDRRAKELRRLLQSPHMVSLLRAHDDVARRKYTPTLPDLEYDGAEDCVKIVTITQNTQPLGVTIHQNSRAQIQIARVLHGGLADKCGFLHVGDKLYEVNGIPTHGKSPEIVAALLSSGSESITLKISPTTRDGQELRECQTRVKALMGYDPRSDPLNPCPQASLAFRRGDILHVVNRDDKYWWQARVEGDTTGWVGLIPCRQLQERRRMLRKSRSHDEKLAERMSTTSESLCTDCCGCEERPKHKVMYHVVESPVYDRHEVFTYEEVSIYVPPPGRYRPIVLIGAAGVGRNELKRRLVASHPGHFVEVTPYTTRPKLSYERHGRDYHFVSRHDMELLILQNRFVEYGQYRGNLYGTSLDSIIDCIQLGKVCVITPHIQALKPLRMRDVRPYFIFIRPPALVHLIRTRTASTAMVTVEDNHTRPFTMDDFHNMIQDTEKLDHLYGHFFDYELINDDLSDTVRDLVKVTMAIEAVPQWVPASWT